MKRAHFSDEQIRKILERVETTGEFQEVCREQNITAATLRRWQRSHGRRVQASENAARPSRSERNREASVVNALGLRLAELSREDLDELALPEDLRDAIDVCQSLKIRARSRQKRRVCQILRGEQHEAIRERLEELERKRRGQTA